MPVQNSVASQQALARKEQEFRDLILKAYRAEPLGGGSFGEPRMDADEHGLGRETGKEKTSSSGIRVHPRPSAVLPSDSFFHGKTGGRLVVVGPINLPVGRLFVEEVITECRKRGASRVDVLAFEFEMGLFPAVLDEAKQKGIDLAPKTIPPEVFDKRAVEKGQVRFADVAYIEVTPRFGLGSARASRAVSDASSETSPPAASTGASKQTREARVLPSEKDKMTLAVELTDFSVYYSQGVADAIAADLKEGKSEVVCEAGKLVKFSKDKNGVITRDVLTKQWTDWVDYWAVDFDYESRKEIINRTRNIATGEDIDHWNPKGPTLVEHYEQPTGACIFENEWQSFRTRQSRGLELTSVAHTYPKPGATPSP